MTGAARDDLEREHGIRPSRPDDEIGGRVGRKALAVSHVFVLLRGQLSPLEHPSRHLRGHLELVSNADRVSLFERLPSKQKNSANKGIDQQNEEIEETTQ